MTIRSTALALLACAALAACAGGGSGSGSEDPGTPGTPGAPGTPGRTPLPAEPTFDELALQNQLHRRHDRITSSLVLAKPNLDSMIPTRGQGAYNGTVALAMDGALYSNNATYDFTPDRADLVANMAVNVDFDTTIVKADLWDFVDREGFKHDGSARLLGLRKDGYFDLSGGGRIYEQSGGVADVTMEMDAYLYGSSNKLLRGTVSGEIDRNGGVTSFTGEAVGEGSTY